MLDAWDDNHTEPITHVCRSAGVCKRLEFGNKEVNISADDALLLEQSLLTEGMRQGTALTGMILVTSHGQGGCPWEILHGADTKNVSISSSQLRIKLRDILDGCILLAVARSRDLSDLRSL